MAEIFVDASNAIVGRLASFVAKQALLGFTVTVVNSEKAVFSGNPDAVRARYYLKIFDLGGPLTGPFISRMPDRFLRRVIRGMVEHKQGRGREAFERIMCYVGVPDAFKDKKFVKISKTVSDLPTNKYVSVKDLCASLGGVV